MRQQALTIVTEILPDRLQDLKNYLKPIGEDIKHNNVIQFSVFNHLHYCCFVVIEDGDSSQYLQEKKARPLLVFEANIDGSASNFIDNLIQKKRDFIHRVYECCEGYSHDDFFLKNSLLDRNIDSNAFYVAYPGQSRYFIEYQNQLRDRIELYIDTNRSRLLQLSQDSIQSVRQDILQYLQNNTGDPGDNKPPATSFLVKNGVMIFKIITTLTIVAAAAILFMLLGFIGGMQEQMLAAGIFSLVILYVILLALNEQRDIQDERLKWENPSWVDLQYIEDRQAQNHLTSITYVKPGILRLLTLRAVLFLVNLAAKLTSTNGSLSGIVTIHFARWVIIPGIGNERARLLFFSSYDGSWENYLGEFIDYASLGLSAIWSNTDLGENRGFPHSKLLGLVKAGAKDERRFKIYARNSQQRELIWYSAYPNTSVKNIANSRSIHEGLFTDKQLSVWLNAL